MCRDVMLKGRFGYRRTDPATVAGNEKRAWRNIERLVNPKLHRRSAEHVRQGRLQTARNKGFPDLELYHHYAVRGKQRFRGGDRLSRVNVIVYSNVRKVRAGRMRIEQ